MITRIQPAPETPWSGPQTMMYIRNVQGAKITPRSGQTQDENAALTRDESKIQTSRNANRGPMKAIEAARQHIGRDCARSRPVCPIAALRLAQLDSAGRTVDGSYIWSSSACS